jgi:hypothetical protein
MKLLERALSEMKTLLLLVLILFKSVALADAERGLKNYNSLLAGKITISQLSSAEQIEVLEAIRTRKQDDSSSTKKMSNTVKADKANINKKDTSTFGNWKVGEERVYYPGSDCSYSEGKRCLSEIEYKQACEAASIGGASNGMLKKISLFEGANNVFENGTIESIKVGFAANLCWVTVVASGIVNGNSVRKSKMDEVKEFIKTDSNKILAHYRLY